jgi:hypothetical protein
VDKLVFEDVQPVAVNIQTVYLSQKEKREHSLKVENLSKSRWKIPV